MGYDPSAMSKYIAIHIEAPVIAEDAIAWKLSELGFPQLLLSERKPDETPDKTTMKLFVPEKSQLPEVERALEELSETFPGVKPFRVWREEIEEEDWAHSWKQFWHPQKIGRVVIKPSWEAYEKQKDELVIELDPKQAFGTGTHPTTQLCLLELERLVPAMAQEKPLRVIDAGTGSGILAIAALLLGAHEVLAFDNDPIAVESTLENARINGVADRLTAVVGGAEILDRATPADLVVVNILAEVIADMAPQLARAVAPGGKLVASGIILARATLVIEALTATGLVFREREEMGEWVRLTFSY